MARHDPSRLLKMIDYLCSGQRISIQRAARLVGFSPNHFFSLDQLLSFPAARQRLREHVAEDCYLPPRYRDRIITSLEWEDEDRDLCGLPPLKPLIWRG